MSKTEISRTLRNNMTDTEKALWKQIREKQLAGSKFRRQQPMGKYVVDFVCLEKKLVVELDGGQHTEGIEGDRERDAYLEKEGYKVLRFWNHEVLQNMDAVLEAILRELNG